MYLFLNPLFYLPEKPHDSALVNFMAPLQLYPDLENDHKIKHHVPGSANNLCTVVAGPRRAHFLQCTSNSGGCRSVRAAAAAVYLLCTAMTGAEWRAEGMQVSAAGEVGINPRQMCITGSYSYYSCSPDVGSLKLQASPRDDKSGTGLHNPVSAIPCTNKQ